MKNKFPILILLFSATAFLFSNCGGAGGKEAKVIWYGSDSMTIGENYHYADTIDSLVQNFYRDKTRTRKKKMEIQKNNNNRIAYRYSIEFDSLGRKTVETYEDLKTTKQISRMYDKSGNVLHEKIDFFNANSGSENFLVDYDGKTKTSIFLDGLDFYQKQEYDSLGKIKNLSMPFRENGAAKDSTIFVLFNSEKEKSEFKDTLFQQLNQLENELIFPVKM